MKCPMCNTGKLRVEFRDYQYLESGLADVVLVGLEVRICSNPECGEEIAVIPQIAALHQVIATELSRQQQKLRGSEIRFLRKYLGWSGADAANYLGVTPETMSRWENEQSSMGMSAERLLRLATLIHTPAEQYPVTVLPEMANVRAPRGPIRLNSFADQWNFETGGSIPETLEKR